MHTHTNVIAFDRNRRAGRASTRTTVRAAAEELRDNVIALADWQGRARARRTPSGVFFTTDVLVAPGQFA